MKENKTIPVGVDVDLYESIKRYCDENGIRLVDFIEDSLEYAIDREEQIRIHDELNDLKKQIGNECEKSIPTRVSGFVLCFCSNCCKGILG